MSEKAKRGRFTVHDERGQEIGSFGEIRRNLGVKAMDRQRHQNTARRNASRAYRYDVTDGADRPLIGMTRQERSVMSAREIVVEEPNGIPIGYITRDSSNTMDATSALKTGAATAAGVALLGLKGARAVAGGTALGVLASGLDGAVGGLKRHGHVRYHLEVAGQRLATIRTPDPDNWGFAVEDPAGSKLATITKDWDGWAATGLKPATHYVVRVDRPLQESVRSLVIAAALSIHVVEERT